MGRYTVPLDFHIARDLCGNWGEVMREATRGARGMEVEDVLGKPPILVPELENCIMIRPADHECVHHVVRDAHRSIQPQLEEAFGLGSCLGQSNTGCCQSLRATQSDNRGLRLTAASCNRLKRVALLNDSTILIDWIETYDPGGHIQHGSQRQAAIIDRPTKEPTVTSWCSA